MRPSSPAQAPVRHGNNPDADQKKLHADEVGEQELLPGHAEGDVGNADYVESGIAPARIRSTWLDHGLCEGRERLDDEVGLVWRSPERPPAPIDERGTHSVRLRADAVERMIRDE